MSGLRQAMTAFEAQASHVGQIEKREFAPRADVTGQVGQRRVWAMANRPRVAAGPGLVGPQSQRRIELDVLRDAERIVDLDPEISNGGSSERCLLGTEATFPVRKPRYF
jgi:hypothetical protein